MLKLLDALLAVVALVAWGVTLVALSLVGIVVVAIAWLGATIAEVLR